MIYQIVVTGTTYGSNAEECTIVQQIAEVLQQPHTMSKTIIGLAQ